jgi:hypothetical protein
MPMNAQQRLGTHTSSANSTGGSLLDNSLPLSLPFLPAHSAAVHRCYAASSTCTAPTCCTAT